MITSEMTERRLTANGLDLVRSGAIEPAALIYGPLAAQKLPADTWADPEFKPYVPLGTRPVSTPRRPRWAPW